MATELPIPDQAIDALLDQLGWSAGGGEMARAVLAAAAPLVVAAELRRLARDYERRSDNVPLGRDAHATGAVDRVGALREFAQELRARADELGPSSPAGVPPTGDPDA